MKEELSNFISHIQKGVAQEIKKCKKMFVTNPKEYRLECLWRKFCKGFFYFGQKVAILIL